MPKAFAPYVTSLAESQIPLPLQPGLTLPPSDFAIGEWWTDRSIAAHTGDDVDGHLLRMSRSLLIQRKRMTSASEA